MASILYNSLIISNLQENLHLGSMITMIDLANLAKKVRDAQKDYQEWAQMTPYSKENVQYREFKARKLEEELDALLAKILE